jgi:hypothetical protein
MTTHGLCGGHAFELEVKIIPQHKKTLLFPMAIRKIYLQLLEKDLQNNYI